MSHFALRAFAGFLLAGAALAQQNEVTPPPSDPLRVQAALEAWQATHGPTWRTVFDKSTQTARFLHGGRAPALFRPVTDADFYVLARQALLETQAMHGFDLGSLVENHVVFLPLSMAGTTDKVSVEFRQVVNGVPVLSGFANVLFDVHGNLLSVDTTGLPFLAGFDTRPSLTGAEGKGRAAQHFVSTTGLPPTEVREAELVIEQAEVEAGKLRAPRLAWQVEVSHQADGAVPEAYAVRVDARNGEILSSRTLVHHFDVSGNVKALATPGAFPDSATNPETQQNMPYVTVTSAQGNATADANGDFTIVGASAPLQATVRFDGTYATTTNQGTSKYTLTTTLGSASGNQVLMNPAAATLYTAEANAFLWIGLMRDWLKGLNPSDPQTEFLALANCNLAQTCNAFFDGGSVNFYQSGGGCTNTAYSSVVLHEMGHWYNVRYGSGNGSDGFGEGNADNFSTYILDDPIVGHDFCGVGCNVRDANNTLQFCGDNNPGCHGGVHANGQVLMGALWKVRTRLKNALGSSAGQATANALFSAWMNGYNDGQIKTIIEVHWLTLDDDDGNIDNGTPNYTHIDNGFKDQGFPGYQLQPVAVSGVTQLPDTQVQSGPYVVTAQALANAGGPIVSAALWYRANGGAFQSVPMTNITANTWSGGIPGQVAPAKVDYYVVATNAASQSGSFPKDAPTTFLKFLVGAKQVLFSTSFETGAAGWTNGSPNGTQNDWQLSSLVGSTTGSFGKSGDPANAATGTNQWGNDLGPNGWNGAYSNSVSNYLRSPAINCATAVGSVLRFKRWLMVEEGQFDQATIKVNGNVVWSNPAVGDLIDSSWVDAEVDIAQYADGNPAVTIEFGLVTDAGLTYGGWNIDDVEVLFLTGGCGLPNTYCTAKTTSSGKSPSIGYTGTPSFAANNFVLTLSNAEANQNGLVFWGASQEAFPFFGGTLCIQQPLERGPLTNTGASGSMTYAETILIGMIGTTRYYQWWFRDPPDPATVGLSNALATTFCN
jgi:hypothetical protein